MAKVILLSQFPLPYSHIGSWTVMYKNYFENAESLVDVVVCEAPETRFANVHYEIVDNSMAAKAKKKLTYYRVKFFDKLVELVREDEKYVIQFVDNFHLASRFHDYLVKKGLRRNCYFQFFYHGFDPFVSEHDRNYYADADEVVLLTHASYRAHLNYYTVFSPRVSILYNGIDTSKFTTVDASEKQRIRTELGVKGRNVFLWCSQDRPKKGLDMILDAWKAIDEKYPGNELLVVGANRTDKINNVRFLGRIPNDELPKYYQASDCYVFPTLCHEGFGLSLIEALNCGCHCIASAQGGVPEVLQFGKLGRLVENPNYISEWETAMGDFIERKDELKNVALPIYTQQEWALAMNRIISEAKKRLG